MEIELICNNYVSEYIITKFAEETRIVSGHYLITIRGIGNFEPAGKKTTKIAFAASGSTTVRKYNRIVSTGIFKKIDLVTGTLHI